MPESPATLLQYTTRAARIAQQTASAADAQLRRLAAWRELSANPLLSLPEAAEALGRVPLSTVRSWIANGRLHTVKIGGKRFVTLAEIKRLRGEQ
jgi:excisionase family DNA binding protein